MRVNRDGRAFLAKTHFVEFTFVSVAGTLLHFLYAWTNQSLPIALIAPVNESVWEHLKMCIWPYVLVSLVEFRFVRRYTRNFLISKAVGLLIMPSFIAAAFYGYTFALGGNVLAADIALFYLAIALGVAAGHWIAIRPPLAIGVRIGAAFFLAAEMLAFSLFTFFPPELPPFRDPVNGTYGVPVRAVPK